MPMELRVKQSFFLLEKGLSQIQGFMRWEPGKQPVPVKASEASHVLVASKHDAGLIPMAAVDTLMRPLIDAAQAASLLEILRGPSVAPADRPGLPGRSREVMGRGDAEEQARFLLGLYVLQDPSHQEKMAVSIYEDLVLPEIAAALGQDEATIRTELRARHASG